MKKKNIHVLLVEPGKAPRSVTVRNTPEGIAEAIGSEEWEKVPIQQDKGPDAVFLSVVMVCRTADLEKEPNPNGGIPGTVLICGIDGNDLTSLPLFLQKQFIWRQHDSGRGQYARRRFGAAGTDGVSLFGYFQREKTGVISYDGENYGYECPH